MSLGAAKHARTVIGVRARLFATLRAYRPELSMGEAVSVQLPAGALVRDLLTTLGVPLDEVKLVFVNGLSRDLEYGLTDGDELGLFPPVGGG